MHFQEAKVEHLLIEESNHSLILLKPSGEMKKWKRSFRFLNAWSTNGTSFNVVQRAWQQRVKGGMKSHITMRELNSTTRALKSWNKNHFGLAKRKIKNLEQDLKHLEAQDLGDLVNQKKVEHEIKI